MEIAERESPPSVRAIVPIDESNVFFLDQRGRIGVAKFSPGLSLIGWESYSGEPEAEVAWNALPDLVLGPRFSVLFAGPREVTQAFDSDDASGFDFFQAVVSDWPGRDAGVTITAGPVADRHGRLLFALSPHAESDDDKPIARLVAWEPDSEELSTVTTSSLPIATFTVSGSGLLAARLSLPAYTEGYYVSLTELPSPQSIADGAPIPQTRPSLLIPAELTRRTPPTRLVFLGGKVGERLLALCPEGRQLVEIIPTRPSESWQGAILLRATLDSTIHSLVAMGPGQLLAGGDDGFHPLESDSQTFRISSVALAPDGIQLDFTDPVDRSSAVEAESYRVETIPLDGERSSISVTPVIESDGRTVVLRMPPVPDRTVVRVVCRNVPSETGKPLLSDTVFYTVHER